MTARVVMLLALSAMLLGFGCATARRTEPLAASFVPTDAVVPRGQQVFYAQCHYCHPHGQAGLGPALNNKPLPGFLMKFQVRRGLGAMPRFEETKIPADDLDALIAYLKALRSNKPVAAR